MACCINRHCWYQRFPAANTRKLQQAERCSFSPELPPWCLLRDHAIHAQIHVGATRTEPVVFAEPLGGCNATPVDAFRFGEFTNAVLGVEDGVCKDVRRKAGAVGAVGAGARGFIDDPTALALGDVSGDGA